MHTARGPDAHGSSLEAPTAGRTAERGGPHGGLGVAGTGRGTCSVEEADTGGHMCHYFDDMSGEGKAIETDGGFVSA